MKSNKESDQDDDRMQNDWNARVRAWRALGFLEGWFPRTEKLRKGCRSNSGKNREGTTTLPRNERHDAGTVPHRQSLDATEPLCTGTLFHANA